MDQGEIFSVSIPSNQNSPSRASQSPGQRDMALEEPPSPSTVKIRAPVDLEGGFEFKANVKGATLNAKVVSA